MSDHIERNFKPQPEIIYLEINAYMEIKSNEENLTVINLRRKAT